MTLTMLELLAREVWDDPLGPKENWPNPYSEDDFYWEKAYFLKDKLKVLVEGGVGGVEGEGGE